MTEICNVKVCYLRVEHDGQYDNLKEFIEDGNNVYIGRSGRVNVDGSMFGFKQSIWNNPYSISEYGRKKCLKMYKQYIIQKIVDEKLYDELLELDGKMLGCWCSPEKCHGDILIKILRRYNREGKSWIKQKASKYRQKQQL